MQTISSSFRDYEGDKTVKQLEKWLSDIGLELKPSKTRLAHTLNKLDSVEPGFNFLGFNVRQFPEENTIQEKKH